MTVIWIDGSCARSIRRSGAGRGGWAAVIRYRDGRMTRGSGLLPEGIGATDAEILALWHALALVGEDEDVTVITDCRALADAIDRGRDIECSSWACLAERLESRTGVLRARWHRRKSSDLMVAVHHLANAARLIGMPDPIVTQWAGERGLAAAE